MPSISLGDLTDRVYSQIDNNTLLYTNSQVVAAINESIVLINLVTGFLQTEVIMGYSQPNRVWYDVPSNILVPFRLQYDRRYLLNKMSLNRQGQLYPNWTTETTVVTGMPVSRWIPVGLTKIGIHPADSLGGCEMRLVGLSIPTTLVNPSDDMPLPNEYSGAVEDLAATTLQLREPTLSQAMQVQYKAYMDQMYSQARWRNVSDPSYPVSRKSRM